MPTPGPPARRSPRTGGWYFQLPTTVFSRSLRHRAPRKPTPINKVVALPRTASSTVLCVLALGREGLRVAVGEAAKLGLLNGAGAPFKGMRAHASNSMFAASCNSLTPVSHMACALLGRLPAGTLYRDIPTRRGVNRTQRNKYTYTSEGCRVKERHQRCRRALKREPLDLT